MLRVTTAHAAQLLWRLAEGGLLARRGPGRYAATPKGRATLRAPAPPLRTSGLVGAVLRWATGHGAPFRWGDLPAFPRLVPYYAAEILRDLHRRGVLRRNRDGAYRMR